MAHRHSSRQYSKVSAFFLSNPFTWCARIDMARKGGTELLAAVGRNIPIHPSIPSMYICIASIYQLPQDYITPRGLLDETSLAG